MPRNPGWIFCAAFTVMVAGWSTIASALTLGWDASTDPSVAGYRLYYGAASGVYTNIQNVGNATSGVVSGLMSGTTYYFAVTGYATSGLESLYSQELSYTVPAATTAAPVAPAPVQHFVTADSLGTLRNNYSGYVGMELVTGSTPICLTGLGRMMASGNSGTHIVKLVWASNGTDVPGASVSIKMGAVPVGQFQYAPLNAPLWLPAATAFYLVVQETSGGDSWYDSDTVISGSSVATDVSPVWGYGVGQWYASGNPGHAFVPVDLQYTIPAVQPYVVGGQLGTLRNNYSGFAGMGINTGTNPVTVTAVGRLMASGNVGTHLVKLVKAADGSDVPGGSANISMTGGTPGQFRYGVLPSAVTLAPSSLYYLVSQEISGGDTWYDSDTTILGAPVASETSSAWGYGPGQWYANNTPGHAFVPVDFQYVAQNYSTYVLKASPGTARNNYSGYVGMQIVTGPTPIYLRGLGRMTLSGNSGTHQLKLVRASDGTDVPGASVSIVMGAVPGGQFQYGALKDPVWLEPSTSFYLVSQESTGGDFWYDDNTVISGSTAARQTSAVWGYGVGQWYPAGSAGQAYVPLDFQYTTPVEQWYVVAGTLGTLRNNYNGFVGMQITTGTNAVTITALGRLMASGNVGTHLVKIVRAADGSDVPGASVNISMSGGTPGRFTYANLSVPVTLAPSSAYYFVSQEVSGGDTWYDSDTTIAGTSIATETSSAWGYGPGQWYANGTPGHTFVPVDFKYYRP